mgnify:CR=1 FL=1|tara:strand:+ start:1134 stop:1367 length:234 start_codon:yes stop_codon:yes gene_type:complete
MGNVTADTTAILEALIKIEGDSDLGLLAKAIADARALRFDMTATDLEVCEVSASQVGDLAYALEEKLQSEITGWGAA